MPQTSLRPLPSARPSWFSGRFADVRSGEGKLIWGTSLVLSGIISSHVLLETARDALFLTELSASSLPFVYLALAALGFVVARTDYWMNRLFGRRNALLISLLIAALGSAVFYLLPLQETGSFVFYLWTSVIGSLLTVQFWLAIAPRFTPGQGRRLYGFVSAGGVIGAVFGGLLGALLTPILPVKALLPAAALLQLLTASSLLLSTRSVGLTPRLTRSRKRAPFRELIMSPYLTRIGWLVLISSATLLLTDYLFKSVMADRVPAERLGVALARYYAFTNLLALIVQVFLAVRILQRIGTIFTLALLPFCLLVSGASGLLLGGWLLSALFMKGTDGALRHSLHRVSSELLFLPLSSEERAKTKPFFDTVLTRATQALMALVLLGLHQLSLATPPVLGLLAALLALTWICVAWALRAPYLERFRSGLGGATRPPAFTPLQLNLDSTEVLLEALSSTEEFRVLGSIDLFHRAGRTGLIPALVLYHPSPRVLRRALEVLPAPKRRDWIPLAERLLEHPEREVRLAAIRALGQSAHTERLEPEDFVEDARLRATTCFFLAQSHLHQAPEEQPVLAEFLREDADVQGQIALLEAISVFGSSRWATVVLLLHQQNRPELARALPGAMAKVRDPRFLPLLVQRLAYREGRSKVRDALSSLGDTALHALTEALYNRKMDASVRLHIPRAIAQFGTKKAAQTLVEMLAADLPGAVRYRALRSLGRLIAHSKFSISPAYILPAVEQNLHMFLKMDLALRVLSNRKDAWTLSGSLFFGLLADKRKQALERVTRLLQLLHRDEDLRRVYFALLADDLESRVAAAEMLEVLSLGFGESLRELLRAVAEPRTEQSSLEHLAELSGAYPKREDAAPREEDILRTLLEDEDPLVTALAATYGSELAIPTLEPHIVTAQRTNSWLLEHSNGTNAR